MSSLYFLCPSQQPITCADISSRLFISCSAFQKQCYLRYHSFSCLLSLSLSSYVLDDAVLSSSFIPHFLVLGHSPFSSFWLHTWSVESLSSSAGRDSFIHRESSQIDGSAVSLRNWLESIESTETRRMETKSLWRTDIFSRGDVSDTVTDVSYHRGKCKELRSEW